MKALLRLVNNHNPNCLFLIETKCNQGWMEQIKDRFGFRNSIIVEPVGRAKGLALFSNEEIIVEFCWSLERIIHCPILNLRGLKIGDILACYGTPYLAENKLFWEILQDLVDTLKGPWMIIGDLNGIFLGNEKIGRKDIWRTKLFLHEFMQNVGGIDLGFNGSRFT